MPNAYAYNDPFVAPQVTQEREDRALAYVSAIGTFPTEWVERLTVLRAYVIACQECIRTDGDTWTIKLAAYSKDFTVQLPLARAAQQAAEAEAGTGPTGAGSMFSIEIERS